MAQLALIESSAKRTNPASITLGVVRSVGLSARAVVAGAGGADHLQGSDHAGARWSEVWAGRNQRTGETVKIAATTRMISSASSTLKP